MSADRDVAAFDARATSYEHGWLGALHHNIADLTVDLALSTHPRPRRLLDVGCGTGYLLRSLSRRSPETVELTGIDPASSMVEVAATSTDNDGIRFSVGVAERLPYADGWFDLVVSTTSFDHWSDQQAGLRECARVLKPNGHLVLVDQFSLLLAPTLLGSRQGKARTKRRCTRLLRAAGFQSLEWRDLYAVVIKAVIATS